MTYSLDLRSRAVKYVEDGGQKTEACRLFNIDRKTLYNWLNADDLQPKPHGPRRRKLDKEALRQHVRDYPDALLRERAAHFGVHINAIWVALKQMNVVKKNDTLRSDNSQ